MRRLLIFRILQGVLFIIIITLFYLMVSCTEDNNTEIPDPLFSYFFFSKEDNQGLDRDYIVDSIKLAQCDTIVLFVPQVETDSLIARFGGDYSSVFVDDIEQISGVTANNFNKQVDYTVISKNGSRRKYCFVINGYNGLPVVEIETEDSKPIESKDEYLKATITIKNTPKEGLLTLDGQIRGRGNVTWRNFPKKPYKIKLSAKTGLFGFPANKDWVLLADYTDKSLMRTAYMSEISKAVGLDFTINYQYIDLYVNRDYRGTYILTDQVEKAESRVNVSSDGYIIEDDTYFYAEPFYFKTTIYGRNYTFKYPKVQGEDESTLFISGYMESVENALSMLSSNIDNDNYTKLIDTDSFAKWYIVSELTGNLDPNIYYYLPSRNEKIKMGPIWDAEWSLGLACKGNPDEWYGWFMPHQHPPMAPNEAYWMNQLYFKDLFQSPHFVERLKANWADCKEAVTKASLKLKEERGILIYTEKCNFVKWPILEEYIGGTLIVCGGWEKEVDYIENWLSDRIKWFDSYIGGL